VLVEYDWDALADDQDDEVLCALVQTFVRSWRFPTAAVLHAHAEEIIANHEAAAEEDDAS
jgi:hypothetical protein